jgi:hypothetical protein
MPFMVIYRTSDGSSCYEQADAIDEAALFVERVRNQEGIDQIRIYRMEEIGFAFRPYYKVELGMAERQDVATPPSASTAMVVEAPVADADAQVEADVDAAPGSDAEPPAAEANTVVETAADRPADAVTDVRAESSLPSRPRAEGEPAGANGRRGLFGR